jgi:catalase
LSKASLIIRFGAIGAVLAGIVGLFAYAGGWLTPHTLSPASMINTFEQVNGPHSGFRRNHAKGVCISGYFESNGRGRLSKAAIFHRAGCQSLDGLRWREVSPSSPMRQTVRSMAILFMLPNGEEWRTGMNNIPVFPVKTAQGFHDQLLASAPDPATGKPDPAKMKAFLDGHPETDKALQLIGNRPISSGFDNSTYNSLNAFRFINASGTVVPVRWSMVPIQPFAPIETTDPGKADKNYLFDALITSILSRPLQWRLVVTVGEPGDATDDATILGRQSGSRSTWMLTIDRVESEDTSPARDINFDPLILPDGIAGSDDPLLSARSAAYAQSFTRREGERKEPSAVSTAETER